jgi:Flp pilus assembly protein TadD
MLRQRVTEAVPRWNANLSRYLVEKLATAEKLLLQEDSISKARGEIEQALAYLEGQAPPIQDGGIRRRAEEIHEELRRLLKEDLTD